MPCNVLITGACGQLGREMRNILRNIPQELLPEGGTPDFEVFCTDIAGGEGVLELDITDREAVARFLERYRIAAVVNCAAYTNVDKAEDDYDKAERLNADGVENLALAACSRGALLLHVSTDYVFGGAGNVPFTEDMPTQPLGVYGVTKLHGEERLLKVMSRNGNPQGKARYAIVRTAWLYSPYGNNFVKTMRRLTLEKERLNVVFDQVGTPTYAADLAQALLRLLLLDLQGSGFPSGTYHFTDEGVCSWYDFALETAQMSGNRRCRILPCHSSEFPSKVKRPNFSVLDKTRIKTVLGMEIPHWKDSLARCIARLEAGEN